MELLLGLTAIAMKVNLEATTSKAMVAIFGPMEENTKVFGRTIKCTEEELLFGLTVENTKDSMKTKRNKAMDSSAGQTDVLTKDNGATVSKMEEVFTVTNKVLREQVYGAVEKKLNGWNEKMILYH